MPDHIHLLPDILINQIAAGEVVQRPASVIKELVENAIDAGSSTIQVVITDAGKKLMQVIDNGQGMSETDARMSVEKHATSKMQGVDDLFNIRTMGFRGEALASIAAVAQLEIETCLSTEELGTHLVMEGNIIKNQTPIARRPGTTIRVKNLFFNIPARRNFLKSNAVETKHIIDEFQRTALARPDIAFSLYLNDTATYQLPATKLSHRIVHLFGDSYKEQLVPCQEATDLIQIKGYIGKPTHAKKNRGEQFFFVNQRFVKSPYLHHAVKQAFEGLLPNDAFPFYVLFIDLPPTCIDVNVHPTKTEVKFEEERMVYAMIASVVRQALAVHHIAPSLDFEQDINFNPIQLDQPTTRQSANPAAEKIYTQFRNHRTAPIPTDWEKLLPTTPAPTQDTGLLPTPSPPPADWTYSPDTPLLQLHTHYILATVPAGLLLIDQRAAHERILYEHYTQALQQSTSASQQLLLPHTVTFQPADTVLLQAHSTALRALGFTIEPFGKDTFVISGCPASVLEHAPQQLLEGLLEQFKWNQTHYALSVHENLARSLAKRACIPHGKKLALAEMQTLVTQLWACTHAHYTPDGRKTLLQLSWETVGGWWK